MLDPLNAEMDVLNAYTQLHSRRTLPLNAIVMISEKNNSLQRVTHRRELSGGQESQPE